MRRTGLIYLAVAVVLLAVGFSGALVGGITAVAILAGFVCLYLGSYRLLWAAKRKRIDLLSKLAAGWMILIVAAAALAPWLPLGEHEDVAATLTVDTFIKPFTFSDHILGTNGNGLDMLARAIYGARVSLVVAFVAVSIGLVVGGIIGVVAGYYRKTVDRIVGIGTNSLLAVPPLILLISIGATIQHPTVWTMAFSLSVLTIPTMIRMARANTIAFSQREFVTAARALGATRMRVMVRELVPNVAIPLLSMAVVVASGLIVAEASLSYLGLGLEAPKPSWGAMIAEGTNDVVQTNPFIVLVPGAFLFLTVFSLNLLGERAQKRFDTRSAKL